MNKTNNYFYLGFTEPDTNSQPSDEKIQCSMYCIYKQTRQVINVLQDMNIDCDLGVIGKSIC